MSPTPVAGTFLTVPKHGAFRIANARVPIDLAAEVAAFGGADRLGSCQLIVERGVIASMAPMNERLGADDLPTIDLDGGMVLPRFVDIHTHLDKGHIWPRKQNPDGTVGGARLAVQADRELHWSAEDVRARMEFSLRCAYAHGSGAVRTHLDSYGKQPAISFPVFAEMREEWKDRIALQAAALFPTEMAAVDEPQFKLVADFVEKFDGVLGGVTAPGGAMGASLDLALDRVFAMAAARGFDVDLHVDESCSLEARSLEHIADAALRNKFKGRVLCGHCVSLAFFSEEDFKRISGKLAEADIAVVSLPMVNLYLQDRRLNGTPRYRGVAPLHELAAAGIRVMVASDNTRDPYYAYGDLDMLEVFREATRILHFDHSDRPWLRLLGAAQADQMRMSHKGRFAVGGPADMILTSARNQQELICRPQADRVVLVHGEQIDTALPDYRELDPLFASEDQEPRVGAAKA